MTDVPPVPPTPPQPPPPPSEPRPTGRTRISETWMAVIMAALVIALLLVFILQNTTSVKVSFFTAHGTMPLGVALLVAVVGGVLLAGVVASLRILQLRHRMKKPERGAGADGATQ